jgi:hypothetical protein
MVKTQPEAKWRSRAKNLLKSEMARREVSYVVLAEWLGEDRRNLTNKINRASFEASFFLQCLNAIGVSTLHLDD